MENNTKKTEWVYINDVFVFAEYCGKNYIKLHGGWIPNFADQRDMDNLLTTEQLYKRWLKIFEELKGEEIIKTQTNED